MKWRTGTWGNCKPDCGTDRIKERNVFCYNVSFLKTFLNLNLIEIVFRFHFLSKLKNIFKSNTNRKVPDTKCELAVKPSNQTDCMAEQCPPRWIPGKWGECSNSCGDGRQSRPVSFHIIVSIYIL